MNQEDNDNRERWVVCVLVTGDGEGVLAVSAEGLMKTALLNQTTGARPIASTVARFDDLSEDDQARWQLLLRREADDW